MTMTARVAERVNLLLENGRPARFFWRERWTVTAATPDGFEFLGNDVRVVGWRVRAQTEDRSDTGEFELARDPAAGGWVLDSVTYA
ncbi:hypothetical protein [Gryllotalpicola protaetiae]|uniref:Uncharacterized protein n=1 Tax=Gryllotalpicola protaetiae TaxID=2419771 RepID=A0A387BMC7_9MICO|nr:hypothetical protein [Gryllotalpicola protaetiae]AYG02359.1 hypothetical protein D7I44_01635 [Gryllotalpicola protaetiae]